ncbi:hypothetical protein HF1_05350 [Mycoplasma haemofelis str. Langford 1]|uniref:Uncharacterized protein n=2 Tax=Mycoplasma haemofelis TaxID=29501 RepID=F6FI05_MYCHI|nr:hypothetical protein [Mycoplasma haemofelis]AEG72853.1 hypothetical protein MHF_0581 [Mycoplasma haemofelis Ohio2]CBY92543.1 hypothetical protein HF1_05350 [Mycoplasma haemofelis str. Langford 1]
MTSGKYLAMGSGALGTVGLGGSAVYMYGFREDTLETRVRNHFKDRKHMLVLNSSTQTEWTKFKEFYSHSTDEKPKDIDKEKIAKWCEEKLASRDESSFELVKKWCVINSRSLRDEALASNRKVIPESGSNSAAEWKSAWTTYNSKKGELAIVDGTFKEAEKTTSDTGGPALQAWCQAKSSQFMYEYVGEDKGYEKYYSWCTKE